MRLCFVLVFLFALSATAQSFYRDREQPGVFYASKSLLCYRNIGTWKKTCLTLFSRAYATFDECTMVERRRLSKFGSAYSSVGFAVYTRVRCQRLVDV